MNDLRFAFRQLFRNPGFTTLAVLILALGIGATTAMFSVADAFFLRPLPFKEPERLVAIWETYPRLGATRVTLSYPDFLDWKAQSRAFEQMAAFWLTDCNLVGQGEAERVTLSSATAEYFSTLGVQALLGRALLSTDFEPSSPRVAVLSHGFWQRRFGGQSDVIGRTLSLDGEPHTVVGVMPANCTLAFRFPYFHMTRDAELWTPLMVNAMFEGRQNRMLGAIARLKPGVSAAEAETELTTVASRLEQQYPQTNDGWGIIRVLKLQQSLFEDLRPALWPMVVAVGFVLLIACANVANMQLVRMSKRHREIALRTALGAGRERLFRLLLVESLPLALLSGLLGLWVAQGACSLVNAYLTGTSAALRSIEVNANALGFAIVLCLASTLITGLAPALQLRKVNVNESLKDGAQTTSLGASGHKLRQLLITSEVALSMVLLVGALLLINSFVRLAQVNPGIGITERILTMAMPFSEIKSSSTRPRPAFFQELLDRVGSLPGVLAAGLTSHLPSEGAWIWDFLIEDGPASPSGRPYEENYQIVTPQYFQVMQIALKRGRLFTEEDTVDKPGVAVISESLARKFWGGSNPLGKRIRRGKDPWRTIIGVVGDVRQEGLTTGPTAEVYLPNAQFATHNMKLVVRTTADPLLLTKAIRTTVQALDSTQPVTEVSTLATVFSKSVWQRRFLMTVLGLFAGMAVFLATVGVYGVISCAVSERFREIGIRLALGATRRDLLWSMVGKGMLPVLIGLIAGLAGALALTRLLRSQLFGVGPIDPVTFLGASFLLAGAALMACYLPARRAAKVDPTVALRYE
jgi:putative ABC transport system permease protein